MGGFECACDEGFEPGPMMTCEGNTAVGLPSSPLHSSGVRGGRNQVNTFLPSFHYPFSLDNTLPARFGHWSLSLSKVMLHYSILAGRCKGRAGVRSEESMGFLLQLPSQMMGFAQTFRASLAEVWENVSHRQTGKDR